ncbi:MAG: hypothetical protein V3U75_09445 [Methylococcaceae bacterium]
MKILRNKNVVLSIAAIMMICSAVTLSQRYQFTFVAQESMASEDNCIDDYSSEENCTDDYDFQCDY